ncbi:MULTISPECIES: hypothetical protein [unclassified Nocardiopsis]|uniref:hypothetical protein n=1 Tax=unclassified Nocardiopsis TaxID=2649073 RepID=UPI001F43F102|nr:MULTISPECIES: hypothetical protein [unclassified Nocardiopsis]
MRVVNLTPHVVTLVDESSRVIRSWPRSSDPARVEAVRVPAGLKVAGAPLMTEERTRANLPEPQEGVWFIVSSVVVFAHPEREDLLVPSDLVRDGSGAVTACRSFVASGFPSWCGARGRPGDSAQERVGAASGTGPDQ